jgi:hypothetical protein
MELDTLLPVTALGERSEKCREKRDSKHPVFLSEHEGP